MLAHGCISCFLFKIDLLGGDNECGPKCRKMIGRQQKLNANIGKQQKKKTNIMLFVAYSQSIAIAIVLGDGES